MPAYQLILSSDTLDQGRIKINDFFTSSGAGILTANTFYSILSLVGNYNYNTGSYGITLGTNNTASTFNYQAILGGKLHYSKGSFGLIGNGYRNKIVIGNSKYSSILNGRQNYVAPNAYSTYCSILGGRSNQINKSSFSTIINGRNNILKGGNNLIMGSYNQIYSSPTGAQGPSASMIIGGTTGAGNFMSGSSNVFSNFMMGFTNIINNFGTFGSSSGFFNYNYVSGKSNRIVRAGVGANSFHNFVKGNYLSTTLDGGVLNGGFNFIFGKGSSLASPLKPKYSYEVVLGTSSSRKFRINFNNGKAYGTQGALTWQGTGADYGEYFEWKDKNINNEERTGFFVEIVDGKIQIAKSNNVVGIISKTTTFVGDSVQDYWSEMHLKDEWGSVLTQKYEMYKFQEGELSKDVYFDQNGVCFLELPNANNINGTFSDNYKKENGSYIKDVDSEIMNPNYDPSKDYVPRKNRKEWEVVGLLGKMRVRTSEQITGNFVDVDTNTGMAKNGTKYPVMQKTKDFDGNYGIVLIFFK